MSSKTEMVLKETVNGNMEETNINVGEAVENLRILLSEKLETLRLPPDGNDILELCLRRRKFSLEEAAKQVDSFFRLFADLNEMNKDNIFIPSTHKNYFFDWFGFGLLKQRDSRGRPIIWVNYDTLLAEKFSVDKCVAVTILILNELTSSLDVQKSGVVFLFEMTKMQFGHVKQFTLSRIRAIVKVMQGAIPVSIKAFHLVNCPAIFSYTYAIIKYLLRKKIQKRIIFHSGDFSELYKDIGRNALPDFLGGDLSIENCVDTEFTDKLCTRDSYYREFLRYGYSNSED